MRLLFTTFVVLWLTPLQTPPAPPASPIPATRLQTRWAAQVTPDTVLPEYPRPQFARTNSLPDAARAALRPGRNVLAVRAHQTRGGQFIDVGIADVVDAATRR